MFERMRNEDRISVIIAYPIVALVVKTVERHSRASVILIARHERREKNEA
jgi:hypothetical protein